MTDHVAAPRPEPLWTPEAAVAYIAARPGDETADEIIRALAAKVGVLLAERQQQGLDIRALNMNVKAARDLCEIAQAERQHDKERIEQLLDLFKHEPYHGIRNKIVCPACFGQGEVNGRNSDDSRWMQCLTCNGDGLAAPARAALAAVREPSQEDSSSGREVSGVGPMISRPDSPAGEPSQDRETPASDAGAVVEARGAAATSPGCTCPQAGWDDLCPMHGRPAGGARSDTFTGTPTTGSAPE